MRKYLILAVLLPALSTLASSKEITRIWLSFKTNTPTHLVINWQSPEPGNSEVVLKIGGKEIFSVVQNDDVTIHHIEVPLPETDVEYSYRVGTNGNNSGWHTFRGMPTKKPLKVAVFADWGFAGDTDISNVLKENPAIIITGGDNVPSLFEYGKEGNIYCIESYLKLIDTHPDLFNHIPLMPVLGNHDKQLHPRGQKPPEKYMVYDTLSTAFTAFFELPGDEWKWSFELPDYNIQFIGLDLNHIGDIGTTWQTCRSYDKNSEQFRWYKYVVKSGKSTYNITINNASNPHIRKVENGIWRDAMENNTAVITGSGYYAEVAQPNQTLYFNTSLIAGDVYADPGAILTTRERSYVLLTCYTDSLTISLKNLDTNENIYEKSF
jgi:hypothetical protein